MDLLLFILGGITRFSSLEEVPQRIFSFKDVLLGRTVALKLQLSGAKVRPGQLSWTQNFTLLVAKADFSSSRYRNILIIRLYVPDTL